MLGYVPFILKFTHLMYFELLDWTQTIGMSDNGTSCSSTIVDEMTEDKSGRWIQDLFPPTFRLSLNEFLSGSVIATVRDQDGQDIPGLQFSSHNEDDTFKKLNNRISPLDIAAIKNVYQRVWLMMKAKELAKDNEEDEETGSISSVSDTNHLSNCPLDTRVVPVIEHDTKVEVEPCIWNLSEIEVLRKAFKSTNDENARLRGQLLVLKGDVKKLSDERRTQRKTTSILQSRLHEAQTANQRLHMIAMHLKAEHSHSTKQLDYLRSVESERNELQKRIQILESELATFNCRYEQEVVELDKKWLKELEDQRLSETASKLQLNETVSKLLSRVEELDEQLKQEKYDHARTKRGLDHLRVHFSSLPTTGGESNAVFEDQLNNLTY